MSKHEREKLTSGRGGHSSVLGTHDHDNHLDSDDVRLCQATQRMISLERDIALFAAAQTENQNPETRQHAQDRLRNIGNDWELWRKVVLQEQKDVLALRTTIENLKRKIVEEKQARLKLSPQFEKEDRVLFRNTHGQVMPKKILRYSTSGDSYLVCDPEGGPVEFVERETLELAQPDFSAQRIEVGRAVLADLKNIFSGLHVFTIAEQNARDTVLVLQDPTGENPRRFRLASAALPSVLARPQQVREWLFDSQKKRVLISRR